jgi:hypothetical protein
MMRSRFQPCYRNNKLRIGFHQKPPSVKKSAKLKINLMNYKSLFPLPHVTPLIIK